MWWLPFLCILIVIVVACIFLPLATTLSGVGGLTIMSGQLGPEGQQRAERDPCLPHRDRERESVGCGGY